MIAPQPQVTINCVTLPFIFTHSTVAASDALPFDACAAAAHAAAMPVTAAVWGRRAMG